MSELAKDVAKELEARARRRKLVMLAVWIVLVVAAVMYLRCGQGWGTGGNGAGRGGPSTSTSTTKKRCQIRLDAKGLAIDGRPMSREGAVQQCARDNSGAEVTVTGDAREGDWAQLRGMLTAAKVDIIVHEPQPGSAAGSSSGSGSDHH